MLYVVCSISQYGMNTVYHRRNAVYHIMECGISQSNLMPTISNLIPTTDSNKLENTVMQDALRDLKISVASDKQEKKMLAFELSKVQQETFTAAFLEEERKIRLDGQDPAAWKALSEEEKGIRSSDRMVWR